MKLIENVIKIQVNYVDRGFVVELLRKEKLMSQQVTVFSAKCTACSYSDRTADAMM